MTARPIWVVVLAHDQLEYTRECLTSLRALDPPADRIIAVDNGSTDGTEERLREEFPSVDVVRLQENRYFAAGINVGIAHALERGAGSVLLLNNDLVLERDAIGALERALDADPRRGAVSPKLFFYEPADRIWFAGGLVTRGVRLIRHRGIGMKDGALRDGPRSTDYVSGAAALLSRDALEQVGLFDPEYVIYVEDVDWSARARAAGFTLWYEPTARGWHHVSVTSGGGLAPLKAYFRLRSGARYLARHAAAWERPGSWVAYLLWTAYLVARSSARGEWRVARALVVGFIDFTRTLLGAPPPPRRPASFAPRVARD